MERNGRARWQDIQSTQSGLASCPKLSGYLHFSGCEYRKKTRSCAEPFHLQECPLPFLPLRNGGLNQLSYSLYFFFRDVADSDFIGWIDRQLMLALKDQTSASFEQLGQALIGSMRHIHAISDKVLNLVLSTLLLGAGRNKSHWEETGASMIAIDTLVHNFLARTGILKRSKSEHAYGPQCYAPGGCADLIRALASNIDSQQFNPNFPKRFPRFVQKSIWEYCAAEGQNICNGNKISDASRCGNTECRIFGSCDRISRY